jgi:hypothetical protein
VLIRDQARRVARHQWVERRLFEIVGSWSADEADADAARVLATESRHHAWRAAMWAELQPVLHDVDDAELRVGADLAAAFDELARSVAMLERAVTLGAVVLPAVVACYEGDAERLDPVSDGPVRRVLELVTLDAKQDWQAAAQLQRSVVRTDEGIERATAYQSRIEALLRPLSED